VELSRIGRCDRGFNRLTSKVWHYIQYVVLCEVSILSLLTQSENSNSCVLNAFAGCDGTATGRHGLAHAHPTLANVGLGICTNSSFLGEEGVTWNKDAMILRNLWTTWCQGWRHGFDGGVNFDLSPPFAYLGDMKKHISRFIVIMTAKRLPTPNEIT